MSAQIDSITSRKLMRLNQQWVQWRHRCNDTEKNFVADVLVNWRIYGPLMRLSVKQVNWITTIYDRLSHGEA